jgi:predicted anti-sigma-YlaC factor YlaD
MTLLAALVVAPGCSVRKLALNSLADTLAASGDVYASDEDPELVREALPFALKTMESLLAEEPRHEGLLLATCQGFTQYAYAFVETDAALVEAEDWRRAEELRRRAIKLYLRARDYGLRALEIHYPGISAELKLEPEAAAARVGQRSLAALYWSGAAWGSAISLGKDRPELVADTDAVRAMMGRALELDEAWDRGVIHQALISIESLPAVMGGSLERARRHFERAVELSGGAQAGPYVSMASNVSVAAQDRAEFERLLEQALAIDPDEEPGSRLVNLIQQRHARTLLQQTDELFLDLDAPEPEETE